MEGAPDVHRAGTALIELPQLLHDRGNAEDITLRLMATWLLPKEEPVTYLVTGETQSATPGPEARINSSADLRLGAGPLRLVQVVRRYPPGTRTPRSRAPARRS